MRPALRIDPHVTIPAEDLDWRAVRSSGPGGQNVNKVASKVELRLRVARTRALDEATKARLRALPSVRLDAAGDVIVTSQLTRDQGRNLSDALDKLRRLIVRALHRPRPRRPTRPSARATERRLGAKQRRGVLKRQRSGRDD
jgi:ribosome-associated protein